MSSLKHRKPLPWYKRLWQWFFGPVWRPELTKLESTSVPAEEVVTQPMHHDLPALPIVVTPVFMKQAPFKDFNGQPIYDGSIIVHPDGMRGQVIHRIDQPEPWRWSVQYGGPCYVPLNPNIVAQEQAVVVQPDEKGETP